MYLAIRFQTFLQKVQFTAQRAFVLLTAVAVRKNEPTAYYRPLTSRTKRRDESRRGTHECVRHVIHGDALAAYTRCAELVYDL